MLPHIARQRIRKIATEFLSTRSLMASQERWVNHYLGSETNIEEICEQFSQYGGGSVDLNLDDSTGIATITLNHPERRNALSGEQLEMLKVGHIMMHYFDRENDDRVVERCPNS